MLCFLSALITLASANPHADTARWLVHNSNWGYVSELSDEHATMPTAEVLSFSDGNSSSADPKVQSTGRIFFYIMGRANMTEYAAAVTTSEASFNGTCGFAGTKLDPEDPPCAKLTISGTIKKSTEPKDIEVGRSALFSRHHQMTKWPAGHNFAVWELHIADIWMIDFFGGGTIVSLTDYIAGRPKRHLVAPTSYGTNTNLSNNNANSNLSRANTNSKLFNTNLSSTNTNLFSAKTNSNTNTNTLQPMPMPPYDQVAARARWLVYNSMWTVLSTVSVRLHGHPWGNVRSSGDGVGSNSTGLPALYIPTPDPSTIDIANNSHCTLSFSEAALPERVSSNGTCGGMDEEDPSCARIHLSGHLRALTTLSDITQAEADLCAHHPLADWLCTGGAHTGGSYYRLELTSIEFIDYYGGFANLTVHDYLNALPQL